MTAARRVKLTHEALRALQEIQRRSIAEWGARTAKRYIADLQAALDRIAMNPGLPVVYRDLHDELKFYRVNRHLFVCDIADDSIVIVAVLHSSMDLAARLTELLPSLSAEIHILHNQFRGTGQARKRRN